MGYKNNPKKASAYSVAWTKRKYARTPEARAAAEAEMEKARKM
jgi:hypothetical protein